MGPLRCSHRKTLRLHRVPASSVGRLATDVATGKPGRLHRVPASSVGRLATDVATGNLCICASDVSYRAADAALDPGLIDLERRRWKRRTTKPHERLVPVSSTPCSAYTSGLSTSSSSTALQGIAPGRPSLEVCFPLRCFQRLSDPDTATQRCHWRDNWYTGGPSNPVLSY